MKRKLKELTQRQKESGKFYRYSELNEIGKKRAHDTVAWNFSENRPADRSPENIAQVLENSWFTHEGWRFADF